MCVSMAESRCWQCGKSHGIRVLSLSSIPQTLCFAPADGLALGHLALPTILELASLFLKHLFHKLSEDSGLAWIANILDTEINQALRLISHPALEDPLSLSLRVSQVTHLSLSTCWHESWGPATP